MPFQPSMPKPVSWWMSCLTLLSLSMWWGCGSASQAETSNATPTTQVSKSPANNADHPALEQAAAAAMDSSRYIVQLQFQPHAHRVDDSLAEQLVVADTQFLNPQSVFDLVHENAHLAVRSVAAPAADGQDAHTITLRRAKAVRTHLVTHWDPCETLQTNSNGANVVQALPADSARMEGSMGAPCSVDIRYLVHPQWEAV